MIVYEYVCVDKHYFIDGASMISSHLKFIYQTSVSGWFVYNGLVVQRMRLKQLKYKFISREMAFVRHKKILRAEQL